ncbi:MAG TPA: GNVR domain-containing protein [bacterium]|nr:GNVR domain-containing protein [bacterium]HPG82740.1 GNVR domain-containing protein [bacterium]HPM59926.1 GNVR domain-containing protein [bacterium]
MSTRKGIDWQMWWQLLLRRRYYIIISMFIALAGGLYLALTTVPVYQSASTVMIVDANLLSGASLRFVPSTSQVNEIDYFRRRITSEGFLLRLLDSLEVEQDPKVVLKIDQLCAQNPFIEREVIAKQVYIEHLFKRISTRMKAYNLIEISAEGPSSEEAFRLATLVTELAIAESQQSQIQSVSAVSSFSSQQLDIYRKRLEDTENRLNAFKTSLTVQGLSENELSREKLSEIQSVKLSTDIDLQAKREQMQKLLSGSLRDITLSYRSDLDQTTRDLRQRVLKRTRDVCELLKKFSWRDVEIILLNEEIGQLKEQIYESIRNRVTVDLGTKSPTVVDAAIKLEELRLDVDILQNSTEILQEIIASHNDLIRRQPSQEGLRAKLEREVQINREIYEALLQANQGSQMRESAEVTETKMRFKLLSPPQRPLERIKPQRARMMFIALFLGLGLGLGMVMAREYMDTSLTSIDDVTNYFKIPVLAAIPKIETRLELTRQKHRRYAAAVAIPLIALVSVMLIYRIFIR